MTDEKDPDPIERHCSDVTVRRADLGHLRGQRIMLVEDEVLVGLDMEYALEDAGAEVLGPLMRVADAARVARAENPAAAILDVDLAGTDVYPVADILLEKNIPFVFHTGHGERKELTARYAGCPVCYKPTPTEILLSVVAGLVGGDEGGKD